MSFSIENTIHCLNTAYNLKVTSLTPLPWGADLNALSFKAICLDQSTYFVKVMKGRRDFQIVQLLSQILTVIQPIKTTNGSLVQYQNDCTLIVYPFIEGENGFHRELTEEQWITLGKTLRQVHEIEVPSSLQKQLRREIFSNHWRDIVRSLLIHIEKEPLDNEISKKLNFFMKEKKENIHRLVDRAEELGEHLKDQSIPYVLCHSDIHAGNVLVTDTEIYIVDWDDPIMAPKERDLMFIGGGVANVWNKPHEEELFYQGYGTTEVNRTILSYYRHERIVEDIAIYGQELLLKDGESVERSKMYQQFVAMFEPNGVMDIALRSF